jgi:hypothetical protein
VAKRRPNQLKRLQALVRKHREVLRVTSAPETHLFRKPFCRLLCQCEIGKVDNCLAWIHRNTRGKSDRMKVCKIRFALHAARIIETDVSGKCVF